MNRSRTSLAALIIAGAALLAPSVASADPWVTVVTGGAPVVDGTTGEQGQPLTITGVGCPNSSGTARMGEFISTQGDPAFLPAEHQFQMEMAPLDTSGGFEWNVNIGMDAFIATFHARWYCASTSVTAITDPAIQWVGPESTLSITAPSAARSKVSHAKGKAPTSVATPGTVEFTVDPDALPLVDRMGIVGPVAARLKVRVDAEAKRKKATNAQYVAAAFKELTGDNGTAKQRRSAEADLDAGGLKVQVVENIALTEHNASWWNKR